MTIFELVNGQAWNARRASRRLSAGQRKLHVPSTWLLYIVACLVVALILIVPGYLLLRTASVSQATLTTLFSARFWITLANTAVLAVAVVLSSAAIAVPLAWLTTSSDLPLRRFWDRLGRATARCPQLCRCLFIRFLAEPARCFYSRFSNHSWESRDYPQFMASRVRGWC
jgi:ABC-type sulfate transport system permease component